MAESPLSTADVFFAMLRRDMRVARREAPFFLLRTAMQPLLLMIIFGYLLPKIGILRGSYTATLLPGVLLDASELCSMSGVTLDQLTQLVSYGVVTLTEASRDAQPKKTSASA